LKAGPFLPPKYTVAVIRPYVNLNILHDGKSQKVIKFSYDTPSSEPLDRRNENSFSDYRTVFEIFSLTAEQN
jgi:hypothetical protein